jgi:hypothetical protein
MHNKGKHKSLTVSDKINILPQVDAYTGTHVEQATWLRFSVPILNPTVKNREDTERSFIQSRPFKQQTSLKYLPPKEMDSALAAQFKEACGSNVSIAPTPRRSACPEIANFSAFSDWISRFKERQNIAYRNLSGESRSVNAETAEDWKNYQLKVMTSVTYVKLIRQVYFFSLQTSLFEDTFAMVVLNLNSRLLCSLHVVKMVMINYHS